MRGFDSCQTRATELTPKDRLRFGLFTRKPKALFFYVMRRVFCGWGAAEGLHPDIGNPGKQEDKGVRRDENGLSGGGPHVRRGILEQTEQKGKSVQGVVVGQSPLHTPFPRNICDPCRLILRSEGGIGKTERRTESGIRIRQ